ncbi:hypothetical protein [Devosia sp. CAU 1758]
MKKIALGLAALTLFAAPAFAQAPLNFVDVDSDASGELSFTELQAVWPDLTEDEFNTVDLDMNGSLSADELSGLQPSTLPAPAPLDGGMSAPAVPLGDNESLLDTTD